MTEKEKMLSGALYNAGDPELVWERNRAKALCEKLNVLPSGDGPARERVLSQLFGHTGGNIVVNSVFWCDYGYNIVVGKNFYSNHNLIILDAARVTIGDNVFIAPNVGIYTAGHPLDLAQRAAGLEYAYPVAIGDDVWIGGGVSILPGVSIGCGTTVGAGSVVTRSLPARVVAAGNPCRVLRQITEDDRAHWRALRDEYRAWQEEGKA